MNSDNSGVTLSVLKELQHMYTVSASRALGQNFLVDPNVSQKIAESIQPQQNVIEIGPGIGSLTVPLARHSQHVYAIEYDQYILDPLHQILTRFGVENKVSVLNEDVMNVDLEKMCSENNVETIIGNLPYNISAPLLANIASTTPSAKNIVAMVQKEVGERLGAPLGTREVSAITYKVQFYMDVSTVFNVQRQSFIPQPRVDSVVIQLTRRDTPLVNVHPSRVDQFFSMIDLAFGQRRKMLRKSLSSYLGDEITAIFQSAHLEPTLRPEQCTLEDFANLFHASEKAHNAD